MQSYDNYSDTNLCAMVRQRGLCSQVTPGYRESYIIALDDLDDAIDRNNYVGMSYQKLLTFALIRGLNPKWQGSNSLGYSNLVIFMQHYDKRVIQESLLSQEGKIRYNYALSESFCI